MSPSRREAMKHSAAVAALLAGAGLWPEAAHAQAGWNKTAFEAKSLADVLKALGAGKPEASKDVTLVADEVANDGAVVALEASTALPGVKRLAFLVEKNPNTLSALFELSDAVAASVAIQVKMDQTSRVYAVAMMGDGRVLFAQKEIQVTLGGCGN